MSREQFEIECGGQKLRVKKLGGRESASAMLRVARVLGALLGPKLATSKLEEIPLDAAALIAGLEKVSEEDFLWFFDRFLSLSEIARVMVGVDGRKSEPRWGPLTDDDLAGQPKMILSFMTENFRVNFGNFFDGSAPQT